MTRKAEPDTPTASEDEGFLGRWSRRKRQAVVERDEIEPAGEAEGDGTAETAEPKAPDLPDVDTLEAGSDFKPFMQQGVPSATRTAALRKLWASNPLYNHIDMLDDYCEDYTDKAVVVPGLKTAYKIGRGLLDQSDELLEKKAEVEVADEKDSGSPETEEASNRRTTT